MPDSLALDLPNLPRAPAGPQATGVVLEHPCVPFPVEVPTRVRPDLAKLDAAPLLTTDSLWRHYFDEKQRCRAPLWIHAPEPANHFGASEAARALDAYVPLIAQQIQLREPAGPIGSDLSLPWLGLGPQRSFAGFFYGLAMSLQEDMVLMTPDSKGELIARALSVCFPSGWLPGEKLGKSFAEIHDGVADNRDILQASRAMSQAISTKGPYVRHVWTLSGGGALARPPGAAPLSQAMNLSDCWFRCERQVTIPLQGRGSLFLIRVYVKPLAEVLELPGRRARLLAALNSMSDALKQYKGLQEAARLIGD